MGESVKYVMGSRRSLPSNTLIGGGYDRVKLSLIQIPNGQKY